MKKVIKPMSECVICGEQIHRLFYHVKKTHGMNMIDYEMLTPYDEQLVKDFEEAKSITPRLAKSTIDDVVQCQICREFYSKIGGYHIKNHEITKLEYEQRFPGHPTVCRSIRKRLSTNNVEFWIKKYGETQGVVEYNNYCKMLADKNSFEYKKKKYGWTREQFNEYNKSRAQSKNNMVTRYGIEEGTKRWSEYVETQRYAGSSLEWFILKHGEEVGLQLWDEINKKKAIGGNNMQVSRIEQAFVDLLIQIPELDDADVMYGEGSQYMVSVSGRYYLYDFVVLKPYKLCIEFHGDYWHCNPVKYAPDFIHSHLQLSAQEIWDKNLQKQLVIEAQGFRYHVVWENDWRTDKVSCLEVITNIIDELSGN